MSTQRITICDLRHDSIHRVAAILACAGQLDANDLVDRLRREGLRVSEVGSDDAATHDGLVLEIGGVPGQPAPMMPTFKDLEQMLVVDDSLHAAPLPDLRERPHWGRPRNQKIPAHLRRPKR